MLGIDFGHGCSYDGGAVSNLITEEQIINEVGASVVSKLQTLGYSIIQLRPSSASSTGEALRLRYTKANDNGVERCISIHANCGGGYGTEVFTYNGQDRGGAGNVLNELVSLGFTNRGIKSGNHLAMIKRPSMTAMLIEICFIDSEKDVNLYKTLGVDRIASAIVKGLTGQNVIANEGSTSIGKYTIGWYQESDGRWWYADTTSTFCKSDWKAINNNWYYFDDEGYTVTNSWRKIKEKWYFFDNDGKMQECGWKQDCGKWYYFAAGGAMLTNSFVVDKNDISVLYYIGQDGSMKMNETFTAFDDVSYVAEESGKLTKI